MSSKFLKKRHRAPCLVTCRPDNTYEVFFNGVSEKAGSLLEDFQPAVNPPAEIDDPEDKKPEDWVDTKRIEDPEAFKVGFTSSCNHC